MNIKELKQKLEQNKEKQNEIETKLQEEYNKIYDDSTVIKDLINKVESSNDYMFDGCGDVVQYMHVNLDDYREEIDYLSDYLTDYGIQLDTVNDCLTICLGDDCILINEKGEVFQSSKLLFDKDSYDTEKEMNEMIEKHMEKTGVFPGVFKTDHYGNIYPHNTLENNND